MSSTVTDAILDALDDLLARERKVLREGDFTRLERIAVQKADLIGRLSGCPEGRKLDRLRQNAERNQKLLDATANGIRSVARRVADIRKAAATLNTYSSAGERKTLSAPGPTVERRA